MIYLYKIGYNCFIIFQYYYLKIKSLKFLKLFENFMKIFKSYEIFESFEIIWQFRIFWKSLKFWNFMKFWFFFGNFIGRLEMKSRLWMDNVEPPNARWTHSEVQPRKYCLGQSANSKIPSFKYTITNWRVSLSKIWHNIQL